MCKETKSVTEFYKHPWNKDGIASRCKKCAYAAHRAAHRAARRADPAKFMRQWRVRAYGTDGENLLTSQENRCAICERVLVLGAGTRNKSVANLDHCHKTGIVRGWLCSDCNRGLGAFKDNIYVLLKAADYLRRQEIFL
jgi:hypothetical protein